MRQINKILILLIGIAFISCKSDFLELVPSSGVSADSYYSNASEIETGIINMYDGIQGQNSNDLDDNHGVQYEFYLTEMRSDNTRTKSQEGEAAQFESFNVTATNGIVSNYYSSYYNIIFRANRVLGSLGAIEGQDEVDAFEGEAKFVRAYAYFNLVRLFGDVPLIDRVITPLEKEAQFTRVATSSVYELIISDLKTAVDNLDNKYRTRASKAAAQTLLAKVYLTTGEYTLAQGLLEDVIKSGRYSLEENFKDIFYTEDNKEVIFAIGYASSPSSDSQFFSSEWMNGVGRSSGLNYVTDDAIAAITAAGGNRTEVSLRTDPFQPTQTQVAKYFPNGESGGSDGKTFASDATKAGNDWIVLRYADVLLMHVEAIMADGRETNAQTAIASFQKVRDRAGLTTPVTKITKNDLLLERRAELAFENHRLFDLIRFGEAESVLSEFSRVNGYNYNSSDLLLPIPQNEINISKGLLKQNPGY